LDARGLAARELASLHVSIIVRIERSSFLASIGHPASIDAAPMHFNHIVLHRED
jgi:arylamine N-acetyltransferase